MTSTNESQRSKPSIFWGYLMKYGLPMLISVGLCYALFHDMDFAEMLAFVRSDCDFRWILASMAVGASGFLFRALRWRMQLKASDIGAPVMPVVYSIVGTYAVNIVFPRLGEFWRSEYISRRQNAPFATVFGSMVADRVADTITVLLLCLLTFFVGGPALKSFIDTKFDHTGLPYTVVTSPWTYAVGILLLIIIIIVMHAYHRRPIVQRIIGVGRNLLSGFMSIFHVHGGWKWLLLTFLLWGSYFLQMWMSFEAFGLTRPLLQSEGLVVVLICFVFGSLSMGVPSNGGIGPYQIAVVFGLECFAAAIDKQQAYAFANVVLGAQTLLTIVLGLLAFLAIAMDKQGAGNR